VLNGGCFEAVLMKNTPRTLGYNVMPFGFINTLAIFQYLMNDIFQEFLDNFVVYYLDDILIFSKNEKDHEKHVWMVLQK
jgi:hypothetical protein